MSFWKNVATFGAHGRIEERAGVSRQHQERLCELLDEVEAGKESAKAALERVVEQKKQGLLALQRLRELSERLQARERVFTVGDVHAQGHGVDLDRIQGTLKRAADALGVEDITAAALQGGVTGVATAMGAWALVGYVGTASTGTAISAIGGVAASNATLAFLGGGALAAGGGGMALGTAVLGGITVIPALIIYGLVNHAKAKKEIKRLAEREAEMVADIEKCRKCLLLFDTMIKRAGEMCSALAGMTQTLETEQRRVTALLLKTGFVVRLQRWFRRRRTGSRYTAPELQEISYIVGIAAQLAKLLDQPMMDEEGNPQ